jgi:hypothetical protein
MTPHPLRRPVAVLAALASVLALSLGLAGAAPAGAHSGAGTLTVEQVHPAGLSVHYIVTLTWDDDGHPAEDATVTATPVAADGTAETPYALAPSGSGDGRYAGAVEFPSAGDWTVRFTSIEPTGTVDHAETVVEGAATTAPAEGGFAPADDGTGDSAAQAPTTQSDDEETGSSSIPILLVVGAGVVAIGGAITAVLAARRNGPGSARSAGGATDTPTASPGPGGATGAGPASGATGGGADDPKSP